MEFLTAEWVAALDEAAASLTTGGGGEHTLQYRVEAFDYYVVFKGGRVRFSLGEAAQPTVSFRIDRATATSIARGDISAISAFMDGRVELTHGAGALAGMHDELAALGDAFAAVRARTRFADA